MLVHGAFDGQQQPRCALHLIQRDRTGVEQRIGITLGLIQHPEIIQCEVGTGRIEGFDQGGFARLARTGDDRHGQHVQGGFEVSDKPAWTHAVHAVK